MSGVTGLTLGKSKTERGTGDDLERQKVPNNDKSQFESAMHFLCIPATSVPSGRLFSKAGEMVSHRRSCVKPDTINQVLFLTKILTCNFCVVHSFLHFFYHLKVLIIYHCCLQIRLFLYCTTYALLVSPSKIKFGLRHKFLYINYINDGIEEQVFSYLLFPSSFLPTTSFPSSL